MQAYNKAIAALVVPIILTGLNALGITADMPVSDAVYTLVTIGLTTFFVWLVPNKR